MTTYTGDVTLQRSRDDFSGYETIVTLEAYGDTKAKVLRKLFLNTFLVADVYTDTVKDDADGRYYFAMNYPVLTRVGNEPNGSGAAISSAESIIRHSAQNIFFSINYFQREVLKEKTSFFKPEHSYATMNELKSVVLSELATFEEAFAAAVETGRWNRYCKEQESADYAREILRKHRVEKMRSQQIKKDLTTVNNDRAALRKKILDDPDTSFWFKIVNWISTF